MNTEYVLKRSDGKFWCAAGRWSDAYPDAFKFRSWKPATEEAMASTPLHLGPALVIADYGTDLETVVLSVSSTIFPEP